MYTVLGFNGSPRPNANTSRLIRAVLEGAAAAGAETRLHELGDLALHGCTACGTCRERAACALPDAFSALIPDLLNADAVVFGSPVYMWQVTGQAKTFMDRLRPVMNADFTTRLVKSPRLVTVFTQGQPDSTTYEDYFEHTEKLLQFLGFEHAQRLVATGTRGPDDILTHEHLLHSAREAGKTVAGSSRT